MELESLRPAVLLPLLAAGFAAQRASQTVLDAFYARSGYPVPYYEGQLSFSADRLRGWYSAMEANGTLGVYWQTQFVDFAFIAATMLFFVMLLAAVARVFPPDSGGRRFAGRIIWLGLAGPLFDVVENLLSFLMLPDPGSISPIVAMLYSSAAALKFAAFIAVYLWTVIGLSAAVMLRLRARTNTTELSASAEPGAGRALPVYERLGETHSAARSV
jgi:hypothetical protein